MKILLTIEEYKERAINLVCEVAKQTIIPTAQDAFKWDFVRLLAENCVTDHIMYVDVANQMYIKVFEYDRNGRRLTEEIAREIDKAEAKEFNAQPECCKYHDNARKSYKPTYEIRGFDKNDWYPENFSQSFDVTYNLLNIFHELDHNAAYHIATESFKRLYGYEYEVDREFKCE